MQIPQDDILIKGLVNNDRYCIETIYKENFKIIKSFILNNKGDLNEAKDVFQEALILLYEKAKNGNLNLTSKLSTYLFAICKNIWLKRLNRNNTYTTEIQEDVTSDLSEQDNIQRSEEEQEINLKFETMDWAMESLGEPCRSLLQAFYIHKKDMREISETFGYTNTDNAKTQKYKCLMRLKKLFFDKIKSR